MDLTKFQTAKIATKQTLDQHKMITRCETRTPNVDLRPNMQHNENKLESLALKRSLTLNLKNEGHWNTKHRDTGTQSTEKSQPTQEKIYC